VLEGAYEVLDGEVVFASNRRVPQPMTWLNSIIKLIGRISTMLRTLREPTEAGSEHVVGRGGAAPPRPV
jgi:hypothetical protein